MARQHVVVDGSNIATEGRSTPSLSQLEAAVAELRKELPDAEVTVVVDATFAHRIDPTDLTRFEEAALRGEYVYPPAGAIGRGDAFLLRIAERVDAVVLSNDSFQEFHGEHEWLFERGRLLGATPVPGIGWIFVPRAPVRGPKSRVAVRDAHRAKERVEKAIVEATREVVAPDASKVASRRSRLSPSRETGSPHAINDPITFISFIADHPLGARIDGEVESFASHGAVIRYGDVRCYAPLVGLASPPPKSAREVLRKGESRSFVVTALDPYRRGVELALPDVAVVSGRPSEETVAAEVRMARRRRAPLGPPPVPTTPPPRPRKAPAKQAVPGAVAGVSAPVSPAVPSVPATEAPAKKAPEKRVPAKAAAPAGAGAAPIPAKGAVRARKAPAEKAPAKKAPAEKAPAKKAPAEKAPAKKAPAEKAPAKKAPAEKAPAKKVPAKKAPASAVPPPGAPAAKTAAVAAPFGAEATVAAPVKAASRAGKASAKKVAPEGVVAGPARVPGARPARAKGKAAAKTVDAGEPVSVQARKARGRGRSMGEGSKVREG